MSFTRENLTVIGNSVKSGNVPSLFAYYNEDDDTVTASDFFDDRRLRVGDQIQVISADKATIRFYVVSAVTTLAGTATVVVSTYEIGDDITVDTLITTGNVSVGGNLTIGTGKDIILSANRQIKTLTSDLYINGYNATYLLVNGNIVLKADSSQNVSIPNGKLSIDDTTEATTTLDGSLQTDGGLSVVKDAVIGGDLSVGGAGTFSGLLRLNGKLRAGTSGDSSAPDIYFGSDSATGIFYSNTNELGISTEGVVRVGITNTISTFYNKLNVNDTTQATTTLDGSLQTDGGLSVVKNAVIGGSITIGSTTLTEADLISLLALI